MKDNLENFNGARHQCLFHVKIAEQFADHIKKHRTLYKQILFIFC